MDKGKGIIIVGIIVLLLLIVWNPLAGRPLQQVLSLGVFPPSVLVDRDLVTEYAVLKAERTVAESVLGAFPEDTTGLTPAFVYSRYPFNTRSELTISVGSEHGVVPDRAVLALPRAGGDVSPRARDGVYVGVITDVFRRQSVVRTVFDAEFRSAVRIGRRAVDALLVGGTQPTMTLIRQDAPVTEGDSVVIAIPEVPYGIAVGEVGTVRPTEDGLFLEADLVVPYDVGTLTAVVVVHGEE